MAFLVLLEALSPVERAGLVRRRQGAGDREAAGPAVARHAAARRPAPPGPGPRRLDLAGLGRRPAERRVVRRQRARGQRGRARRGRRRGQAIRAVVNPGKLGHIGPVSDVARLPPAQNAQFRAPKYGHPANGDPVQNGGYIASSSRGPGTERDIRRRALDWLTQRDPGPLTSADTVPPGLGTAAPQAALISGLACGHPAGGLRQGHDRRPARRCPGAVHRDRAWPPRR